MTLVLPKNCTEPNSPLLLIEVDQIVLSSDPRRLALLKDESNIEASLLSFAQEYVLFYKCF